MQCTYTHICSHTCMTLCVRIMRVCIYIVLEWELLRYNISTDSAVLDDKSGTNGNLAYVSCGMNNFINSAIKSLKH